ncbi:MAG: rhodanese-like domain-containing protein [Verrucomicrobia subdivision 3 bacterium]|nr:rhodanese-like domain-containing protein [Limisphaerales bacterium]
MASDALKPKRNWRRIRWIIIGVTLATGLAFWLWLPNNGIAAARKFIRWHFDDIPHITPAKLTAWIADANRTTPLLWDIRRADEFAVSHLPNAQRVPPETAEAELQKLLPANGQPIVVYCAVGYRSAKMAQRLRALGHTKVFNLEGAIFAWASEGLPLAHGNKIHPYNAFGRRMLRDDLESR